MPTMTITWHTHLDERTCVVCAPLDGYEWKLNIRGESFPNQLEHPDQGVVWNTRVDESRTHGVDSRRGPWNCRCSLTWAVDGSDMKDRLLELVGKVETWQNIGDVLVAREGGRFVAWRKM